MRNVQKVSSDRAYGPRKWRELVRLRGDVSGAENITSDTLSILIICL
jgi:hypothetical protein